MRSRDTKIDYDNLPPLVPKGEDREAVIKNLVTKWATPVDDLQYRHVLSDVALIDKNTDEPIDLGDILRAVNECIGIPKENYKTIYGVRVSLIDCRVDKCDATQLTIPYDFETVDCLFREAIFDGAVFRGIALFGEAVFRAPQFGGTWFGGAKFHRIEGPDGDMFRRFVKFARFAQFSGFNGSEIRHIGEPGGSEFLAARFDGTDFLGDALFNGAEFHGDAWFDGAKFHADTKFINAKFREKAWFGRTKFRKAVAFKGAEFHDDAWFFLVDFFSIASFNGIINHQKLYFMRASFTDAHIPSDFALNAAHFSSNSKDSARFGRPPPRSFIGRIWHELWTRGDARLQWGTVRGFGELSILTRVSTSALVIVPMLAALWPSIRAGIETYARQRGYEAILAPNMPWAWGFLFFASLFVFIGRSLYQSKCPQEVRQRSRVDVLTEEMDEFRKNRETEGDRRLSEAINAIEEAGTHPLLRWFRHPNLVTNRDGRTVWIPSRLEDFHYDPEDIPESWKQEPREGDDPRPDAQGDELPDSRAAHASTETVRKTKRKLAESVMSRTAREDIVIRAGADARYDIIARQNRWWARASLLCYTMASVLVGIVIWKQCIDILHEMGWKQLTLDSAARATYQLSLIFITAIIAHVLICASFEHPYKRCLEWLKQLITKIRKTRSKPDSGNSHG